MSRKKMKKARPYENLLILMLDGQAITKEQIGDKLGWNVPRGAKKKGPKIYNVSSYIWDIKNIPQSPEGKTMVVKSIRDGKKVTAYQLMNVDDAKSYLRHRGLINETGEPVESLVSLAPTKDVAVSEKTAPKKSPKKKAKKVATPA